MTQNPAPAVAMTAKERRNERDRKRRAARRADAVQASTPTSALLLARLRSGKETGTAVRGIADAYRIMREMEQAERDTENTGSGSDPVFEPLDIAALARAAGFILPQEAAGAADLQARIAAMAERLEALAAEKSALASELQKQRQVAEKAAIDTRAHALVIAKLRRENEELKRYRDAAVAAEHQQYRQGAVVDAIWAKWNAAEPVRPYHPFSRAYDVLTPPRRISGNLNDAE